MQPYDDYDPYDAAQSTSSVPVDVPLHTTQFAHYQPQPLPLGAYQPYPALTSSQWDYTIAPSALSSSAHPPSALDFSPGPYPTPTNTSSAYVSPAPTSLALPDHHRHAVDGAVASARWTGERPSLPPTSPVSPFSPALPLPPAQGLSLSFPEPVTGAGPSVGLAVAWLDDAGKQRESTAGPARRRSSTTQFEVDSVLHGPTGVQSRIKPFISKLNHVLKHPESYADVLVWDGTGDAFIVHHCARFHDEVLPKLYGHSQSTSFTRQLNVYGFRRLTTTELSARIDVPSTANYSGWIHPLFKRGADSATLQTMMPRPSRARQAAKEEKESRKAKEREAGSGGGMGGEKEEYDPDDFGAEGRVLSEQ
ncbi:hypothetical protein JCM8547_000752 [Rhodosporidiobolus lusitaniae]